MCVCVCVCACVCMCVYLSVVVRLLLTEANDVPVFVFVCNCFLFFLFVLLRSVVNSTFSTKVAVVNCFCSIVCSTFSWKLAQHPENISTPFRFPGEGTFKSFQFCWFFWIFQSVYFCSSTQPFGFFDFEIIECHNFFLNGSFQKRWSVSLTVSSCLVLMPPNKALLSFCL